jgi:hypothetical protein
MTNFLKILVTTGFVLTLQVTTTAQEIWTIGPMLHVNFGEEKPTVSFAIEAAYWNVTNMPYSVDFGIEFDRKKTTRLYTELQTGIGVAGISLGPVFQYNKTSAKLGLQGSCWVNYFLGVDYRMRFLRDEKIKSVGTYVKLPVATSGLDDGDGDSNDWGDWD